MTPDTTILYSTILAMEGVTGEGRSHNLSVSETVRNFERKKERKEGRKGEKERRKEEGRKNERKNERNEGKKRTCPWREKYINR